MNDDRLHDLLVEVLTGDVNVSDNQSDYSDWKFLIDNGFFEHSKPRGSAGSRTKTINLNSLTDSGKRQLDKLQAT
jgi:hypothetical protein